MKPAARSRSWFDHATLARIGVALGVVLGVASFPGAARADVTPSRELVVIPSECAKYWSIPGGVESPAGWNQLLSFAACVQDATVARIESERSRRRWRAKACTGCSHAELAGVGSPSSRSATQELVDSRGT